MAEPIGALRVDVAANVAQIQADMGAIKNVVNSASSQISSGFGSFATSANKALNGIFNLRNAVEVAAAVSFVALIKKSIDAGNEIAKTAQKVGISTDALQEMRYAASSAGVTTGEFDQALLQLSKRLGDTSGDITDTQKALGRLGISMADVKGKDTAQVVALISDRIKLVPDAMERAKIATDLFGRSGQQLLPVLMSGSAGFAQLADQAHELGLVISGDTLKKTEEANDEFQKISTSLTVAGVNISAGFLPALKEIRSVVTSPDFQKGVGDLADNFGRLIKWMVDNKGTVEIVAGALAGMKVGRMFGPTGAAAGAVVGGLLGTMDVSGRAGDLKDVQTAIKSINDEIVRSQATQSDLAQQIISAPSKSVAGALRTRYDALSAAIGVMQDRLTYLKSKQPASTDQTQPMTRITITADRAPIVDPLVQKEMDDLSLKTRILNGDFNGLAEGFPELAHGLKLFGTTAQNTTTDVSGLSPDLQKLNKAMLDYDAARTVQQTRPQWETDQISLQRLNQELAAGSLSAQRYARAVDVIKMPSLTRAIDDATNLNKAFDQVATSGLTSAADALADMEECA